MEIFPRLCDHLYWAVVAPFLTTPLMCYGCICVHVRPVKSKQTTKIKVYFWWKLLQVTSVLFCAGVVSTWRIRGRRIFTRCPHASISKCTPGARSTQWDVRAQTHARIPWGRASMTKGAKRESDAGLSAVSHLGVSLWFRPWAQISSEYNR